MEKEYSTSIVITDKEQVKKFKKLLRIYDLEKEHIQYQKNMGDMGN